MCKTCNVAFHKAQEPKRTALVLFPGDTFVSKFMEDTDIEVKSVDEANNLLAVKLTMKSGYSWSEDDWNLEHVQWGFERHDYFKLKRHS